MGWLLVFESLWDHVAASIESVNPISLTLLPRVQHPSLRVDNVFRIFVQSVDLFLSRLDLGFKLEVLVSHLLLSSVHLDLVTRACAENSRFTTTGLLAVLEILCLLNSGLTDFVVERIHIILLLLLHVFDSCFQLLCFVQVAFNRFSWGFNRGLLDMDVHIWVHVTQNVVVLHLHLLELDVGVLGWSLFASSEKVKHIT